MISAAFIVPHSPILIPAIGKANTLILHKTLESYKLLKEKIESKEIETIIIITPHGDRRENLFVFNAAPEFDINFKEFGDYATETKIAGDINMAQEISEMIKPDFSANLTSQKTLDYGSSIPLYLLTSELKDVKTIPISQSSLDLAKHYDFGKALQKYLIYSEKKIALIASADLSHRLKRSAPGGYSPKGAKFDNRVMEYLNNLETAKDNFLNMDTKAIADVKECGLKSIMMILGAMDGIKCEPQILSYQPELGVGYLSFDFGL